MNNLALILVEQTGVEFYTVASTGESGISISGLAVLCGVTKQAISKLVSNLSIGKPTKRLERFVGQCLDLATDIAIRGGQIRALKAEVCVEIIKHYAYSGNETAQFTLDKFAIAGFNCWVQSITGWQSPIMRSHPQPQTPPPTAQPKSLPPAPGWKPEVWNELPEEDKQHFSESQKQVDTRLKRERADIDQFLDRCWYRR